MRNPKFPLLFVDLVYQERCSKHTKMVDCCSLWPDLLGSVAFHHFGQIIAGFSPKISTELVMVTGVLQEAM